MSDLERSVSEREKQVQNQMQQVKEFTEYAKENSLGVLEECAKSRSNQFYRPTSWSDFFANVAKALTGAWGGSTKSYKQKQETRT